MNNFQDSLERCLLINKYVNLLSRGNIFNLNFEEQEYIIDNNLNANYLLSFEQWKDKNANILKGSKAIRLPNDKLVFDVNQTNYKYTIDEEFPNLIYDLKSANDFKNLNALIDSFISDNPYDINHIQYNGILNAIVVKRFLNKDYFSERELEIPENVDLSYLSDINSYFFNSLKSIYNRIKYETYNDSISLSSLLDYAIDNKLGGKYYGETRNDNDNEDEIRLAGRISTTSIAENERQRDSTSTLEGYGGVLHQHIGESRGLNENSLRTEAQREDIRTNDSREIESRVSYQTSSEGDSTSGYPVQTDRRGIDQSDNEIAFFNYRDFAINMNGYGYVRISEGTGDNLLPEDRENGYVDYINYSIYETLEDLYNDEEMNGGMALLDDYYSSIFHNADDVINYLIGSNELPFRPYEIVDIDEPDLYSFEQLSLFDDQVTIKTLEHENELVHDLSNDVDELIDNTYKDSSNRLSGTSTPINTLNNDYLVYDSNATDMWNGIFDVASPQDTANTFERTVIDTDGNIYPFVKNKTFDDLNDDERKAVENNDDLYLTVYNNTVDKMYQLDDEMRNFLDNHPYGSNDGIKNPDDIKVLAKYYTPIGSGTWIATEFDGYDENGDPYLYGCANLGYGWEWGMLPTFSEMSNIDLGDFYGHLRIEKDVNVEVGESLYDVLKSTDFNAFNDLGFDEITFNIDDEIKNYFINRGSNVSDCKYRIYQAFTDKNLSKAQLSAFLKSEYGWGGSSHPRHYDQCIHTVMFDKKGIKFSYYNSSSDTSDHEKHLDWNQVRDMYTNLINNNAYFNSDELNQYNQWLLTDPYNKAYLEVTGQSINSFDSDNDDSIDDDNDDIYPVEVTNLDNGNVELLNAYDNNSSADNVVTDFDDTNLKDIVLDLTGIDDNADNIDVKYNPTPINYTIKDDNIGVGTPLERYNNNIQAIKLLKQLESEDRNATQEEQDILAKYVGWGGLSDFFDESRRPEQYNELNNLLTDLELAKAKESTLTAFYTQPIVVDTIYKALDKFGFKSGNILEPSCAIGNFFGRLPENMSSSNLYGVELDSLSARIAKKLYPNANIQNTGFENTTFDDNFFDVAIGNVPFGDFKVIDKRYDKYNFNIHDYFFAKTIDKVKPGGVIAFITSKGTMDKINSKARDYIAERCDLIGSIRLPKEAFKGAAGTDVVSDIIFLSKRETPRVKSPSWTVSTDSNFMYVDYFDKYMSKSDIENEILDMLKNKDFERYNDFVEYCRSLDEYNYFRFIDPTYYSENYDYSPYTRGNTINRWTSTWNNRYGGIKSTSSYNLSSCGAVELYRWFLEDPESVTSIVANSGKFDKKAKTEQEKYDLAYEYLTISEDGIENRVKSEYVDELVRGLIININEKDQKTGQYKQAINNYYVDNKDMIIGNVSIDTSRFGYDLSVSLKDDSLSDKLSLCLDNLNYEYKESEQINNTKDDIKVVPANLNIKNFSYGIINDEIYYRTNSTMQLISSKSNNYDLLKDTIKLNQVYTNIIAAQLNACSDDELVEYQSILNSEYDSYVEKYGRINTLYKKLKNFIDNDSSLDRISALENIDNEDKKFIGKADIFTQRTIYSGNVEVEKCDTSFDALLVSLRTKLSVDLDLMSELTNKPIDDIISDLKGTIYRNHNNENEYLSADEYLSGNVKIKLKEVEEMYNDTLHQLNNEVDPNIKVSLQNKLDWLLENKNALIEAQPIDLQPFEIDMPLGASWIPEKYIEKFALDVICDGNYSYYNRPKVLRSSVSKNWFISNKTKVYNSSNLNEKYGLKVKGHNGLDILESCLNLKREEVAFYVEDENGKKVKVIDKEKTLIAIQKQDLIKREFTKWLEDNETIHQELADIYNERFNCIVDRKYNPNLIDPIGLSKIINGKEIKLYDHQKEAVAKALFGGNTGVFHSVGAGKTLTLATIAMESKRLGLCNKSLFVVPKSIVGQWGKDFVAAYPNANVLVADEKSFSKDNRRRFINKIASGNYDAIIISNDQFKLLKLSDERVISYINEDIDRIQSFIEENKYYSGLRWTVKQAESMKKKLESRITKRMEMAKDDFIDFEELGIDKLFIDESHNFKNLAFETSLSRIKGIGSSADAQKSNDLYYKTKYLNQLTDYKGIVFATGTPISNYLAEMFTIQRYLQPQLLEQMDVDNFDSWVSVFGEIVEEQQLDITGTKYVPKAVLKRYHNLPELMSAFRQIADIKTQEDLDLEIPDAERVNVEIPRSEQQAEYLDELNERLDKIRNNQVDPTVDNMLLITNDGRKMALDQRLVNKSVNENQKVKCDYVVDKVYQEYMNSNDILGTQAIFSDLSTPSDNWNIYDQIKDSLVEKGIPADEIKFVHDYETQKEKDKLFSLINDGKVRIILGSTKKLGTGVNMQKRMVAIHHIDVPWKPSDIEQREGRAIRQGNTNKNVRIYRYVTADTFDAYSWQIIENKATFISQIMTNKNAARTCDDLDETVMDAAEIKAIATGNPLIKERMILENDIKKLSISKNDYLQQKVRLKDDIAIKLPNDIAYRNDNIARLTNDINKYKKKDTVITELNDIAIDIIVNNKHYTDYRSAGEELLNMAKLIKFPDDQITLSNKGKLIGKYQDFEIRIGFTEHSSEIVYTIGDQWISKVNKYESPTNMTKFLIAELDNLQESLDYQKSMLDAAINNLESSKKLLSQPFEFENELIEKQERLNEIIRSMDSNANYSSDENLDGEILYDEKGNVISNDFDDDSESELDDDSLEDEGYSQ